MKITSTPNKIEKPALTFPAHFKSKSSGCVFLALTMNSGINVRPSSGCKSQVGHYQEALIRFDNDENWIKESHKTTFED